MSKSTAPEAGRDDSENQFGELLDLLGIEAGERVSICSQKSGRRNKFDAMVPRDRADAEKLALSTLYVDHRDVWFGVNPVAVPDGYRGRGGDEHVSRCTALFADIDIKNGGVSDSETAATVAKEIAAALGQPPVAVVFSGHGGHPYWTLDPDDDAWTLGTDAKRVAAQGVYRRFQRLCADIAGRFGGGVDNVGQLSRILRVPGTYNRKDPAVDPILVELTPYPYGAGGPLSFAEVVDALDAYGVPETPEDRELLGPMVSDPVEWEFGAETSAYVAAMVAGWRIDTPGDGVNRHNWLVSQAVRLHCAYRLGRITEADYPPAAGALAERFAELLADPGDPRRPTPGEVAGAMAWGVQRAATFTDDRAADEIGGDEDGTTMTDPSGADGHGRFDADDAQACAAYDAMFSGAPLPIDTCHGEAFPTQHVPAYVADMIDAVAEAMKVDTAMSGAMGLGGWCTASNLLPVRVTHPDPFVSIDPASTWIENGGDFIFTVASSGTKKSPAMKAMARHAIIEAEEILNSNPEANVLTQRLAALTKARDRLRTGYVDSQATAIVQGVDADRAGQDEPVVETAIRIRSYLDGMTAQGATRAELGRNVSIDGWIERQPDKVSRWKTRIDEAVDLGLQYGLIETLSGTSGGARYVASTGTVEEARQRAAAEADEDRYSFTSPGVEMELIRLDGEIGHLESVLAHTQLFVGDITPEAFGPVMDENRGQVSVVDTENVFKALLGRYSNGDPDITQILRAYSGDPIRVNRKGGRPTRSPSPP